MDEHFRRYLETCRDIYERHVRAGTWPWTDSTNPEDVIDSESDNDKPV